MFWRLRSAGGTTSRVMRAACLLVGARDIDRTARLLAAFISRLDDAFLGGLAEEV